MAGKQSSYEKHLQRIADSLGENLIPFLNKDELLKQITPSHRISGLTLSERLHGLSENDLRSLNPETKEMLQQLMKGLDEGQN